MSLLGAALYLHTLRFGFVFDDQHLIANNAFLREPWSPLLAFAHDFWHGTRFGAVYYRPIVNASFALNGRLLGWGPAGFHLVNVILHALNAALVLALARRLGAPLAAALLAGCLFAVHPVAAWPVASIVARVDLLPVLFVLLAWIACESGRPIVMGLLFLAALLSKESAVAFLVVPLLGLRGGGPHRRLAVACAGGGLAVYLVARHAAGVPLIPGLAAIDPITNPLAFLPPAARFRSALALSGRYLLYLVLPIRFSDGGDYLPGGAPPGLLRPDLLLAALVLIGIAVLLARLWWRGERLAAPFAFGLGAFLPSSNLLVPIGSLYAQNFLYLPLAGLCLAAGLLLGKALPASRDPKEEAWRLPRFAWLALPLLIVFARAAAAEASIWRDEVSLFSAWSERFPHYPLAQSRLGVALLAQGDPAGARVAFEKALVMNEHNAEAHYNLGVALILKGESRASLEEALVHLRRAVDLTPDLVEARVNASKTLLLLGRPGEAEKEARQALVIAPGFAPARVNLAESLFRQSRYREALPEFRELARQSPTDPNIRSPLLVTLIHVGDLQAARAEADDARRTFPSLAWFDFCLARVEARSGHGVEAIDLLRAALAKDPATRAWIRQVDDFDGLRSDRTFRDLQASDGR